MNNRADRILIVDNDPDVLDLLANQTLGPSGYKTTTVNNGPGALDAILDFAPDIIVVALDLIGFTGKDLLAAMRAQGLTTPVIVTAPRGDEEEIIDAFRLGARDYLVKPLREAEVISAVDRVMAQIHVRRERKQLQNRLKRANKELEQRVKELTTLFGIGKAVTNLTDIETLFTRLVEASLYVTGAKMGWMLLRDDSTDQLVLRAARNVPRQVSARINKPWNGGLGPMVVMSGEPLQIAGEGLKRFTIGQMAKSALVVPVVVRNTSVGVLVVANPDPTEFTERHQAMMVAVADYASIAIVNTRLFRELAARANQMKRAMENSGDLEQAKNALQTHLRMELRTPIDQAKGQIGLLLKGDMGKLERSQHDALLIVNNKLQIVLEALNES